MAHLAAVNENITGGNTDKRILDKVFCQHGLPLDIFPDRNMHISQRVVEVLPRTVQLKEVQRLSTSRLEVDGGLAVGVIESMRCRKDNRSHPTASEDRNRGVASVALHLFALSLVCELNIN
ncbi:hypothetical protein Plhal304r1_c092g0172451 [Plasmopara halstedii]